MPGLDRSRLPVAIVAGSAIIGGAIYFGLRERSHRDADVVPASPTSEASREAEPSHAVPIEERVRARAQAALDALRPALSRACWTPPGESEPAAIVLEYDVTLGADGRILALGVGEQRQAHRSTVAQCVRAQAPPELHVDPPGTSVRVALTLRLP